MLERISPFLSKRNRLTIFYTFILSYFNYCPLAWHLCNEKKSRYLEKLQERALKLVNDNFDSPYVDLLAKTNIPSLHIKRHKNMAIETFEILSNMSPPVLSDLINLREN